MTRPRPPIGHPYTLRVVNRRSRRAYAAGQQAKYFYHYRASWERFLRSGRCLFCGQPTTQPGRYHWGCH